MKRKIWTLVLLSMVAVLMLSACAKTATPTAEPTEVVVVEPTEVPVQPTEAPAPTEAAAEPVATLRIWADDTRTEPLLALADDFLAEYNVQLVVEDLGVVQDIRSQAIIAIPAGEGNLYGLPYATENLGFFYNTDLVTDPPTTWDGVLEIGRTLKAEGKVQYAIAIGGDPGYNSLPMQTAFGGYVFGVDENGAWNPDDVGLDSEGEIAAVTWMTGAVEEGLMPDTTDYDTAHSMFETGQIPFLMAGPWALDRIRASGVPYAVAPFFPDDGAPFLGVQGFFVNPYSENVLLAQAFLTEFVATPELMQTLYETGNRPSALKSVLAETDDPDLKAMGEAGVNAIPMPNIPEMGSVWSAWNNGITLAITGEQTPEAAMTDAANQVRTLIAGALAGMVNLPGSYQKVSGLCGADWDPACEGTAMTEGEDGLFTLVVELPAGDYEFKVALNGDWGINYGSDGEQDGPNYLLSLAADSTVTFTYDPETHLVETAIE
jgi:arabinogalactan oligomer/maltooligosaccharide transport system substrate-binding protein